MDRETKQVVWIGGTLALFVAFAAVTRLVGPTVAYAGAIGLLILDRVYVWVVERLKSSQPQPELKNAFWIEGDEKIPLEVWRLREFRKFHRHASWFLLIALLVWPLVIMLAQTGGCYGLVLIRWSLMAPEPSCSFELSW